MKVCKEYDCTDEAAPARSRCWHHYYIHRSGGGIPAPAPEGLKILMVDIETTPTTAYTWGIHDVSIGINQIIQPGGLLCFSAKWYGNDEVLFYSSWEDGHMGMVLKAWELMDTADVLMHWNGTSFDRKHLNREFLLLGFPPPSKSKDVDLLSAVKKNFRFISNKLQHVSVELGLPGKIEHEGFPLWVKCMAKDPDALKRMEEYNRQDVILLEAVHDIILPWIPNYPNRHLYEAGRGCPTCAASADRIVESGYYYTQLSRFLQYRCQECNGYFRSSKRDDGVTLQGVAL